MEQIQEKLKDMIGVESPKFYKNGEKNEYVETFSYAITHSIKSAISNAGGYELTPQKDTIVAHAAAWFLAHYPASWRCSSIFSDRRGYYNLP